MAFRMARMARAKSGSFKAPKGIPKDARDAYQALYGKRHEELFRAPPDCSPQRAKALHGAWLEEIESRIATIRAKQRGEGHDLTQRQARALAGEWYRWFVARYEENPGEPSRWSDQYDSLWDWLIDVAADHETSEVDMEAAEVRAEIHPRLADVAKTAQFLASKGEVLTPAAMTLFLDAVLHEFLEATQLLRRRAPGDYSPDQHLQTLPEYRKVKPVMRVASKTCLELFGAYFKAAKPAQSTVNRWRVVFTDLDKHIEGRNIDDFTADEAQSWARSLVVTDKRTERTVSDIWVAAAKTVFGWALKEKLTTTNPFAGVSIRVPKKVIKREHRKGFSPSEQQTILKAALAINDTNNAFKAACRWVPWLCAYSGARAGEITQLARTGHRTARWLRGAENHARGRDGKRCHAPDSPDP
jgi:hypothetical protein